jgi:allantoin racemase
MRLRVILPIVGDTLVEPVRTEVADWASPGTEVDVVPLARGTASIESEYDEALAAPGILDRIAEDGVDGAFVSCFADPGVAASREVADFPVVGGFEPALLTALGLGERIGVVTVLPNVLPMLRGLVRKYGLTERLGCIRVVDTPVLELEEDTELLVDRLYEQSAADEAADEADVIVLGSTGMIGVARALQERLSADGAYVPVVDPTGAAITWLESAVRLGVRPSRMTYMPPRAKERIG